MSLAPPFPSSYWADPFGDWPQWRKDAGLGPHRGLDMNGLPKGTPIPASGRGRVTWRTNLADPETTELGHRIVVFYPEANVYLGYSHLHESPSLNVGDEVALGQTVGLLGNSGTASTGAHLHLTASRSNGNPGVVAVFDPATLFAVAAAPSAPSSGGSVPLPNYTSGDDMGFQIKRKDNGKTYQIDAVRVTHVVHDDVARLMPYIGQGIYGHVVSKDDFRRIVEEQGWPYDRVAALPAGQALVRGVTKEGVFYSTVYAGQPAWPAVWS